MLETAARNLTFATMELGGKNALLVLEDADLDVALDVALEGMFYNQGEACTSTARILVHDSIYDEFSERFAAATEAAGGRRRARPRDRHRPDGRPPQQRDKVLEYLRIGLDEGARMVTQGTLPDDERLRDGFWVRADGARRRAPRRCGSPGRRSSGRSPA